MRWLQTVTINGLAALIRATGRFPGKSRLMQMWWELDRVGQTRIRLMGSGQLLCDLAIPYEAMIWLEHEEESDLHILRQLLQPGTVFVDAGANVGLWTIAAGDVIGGEFVYSFEPNPRTAAKLRANAARSARTSSTRIFNSALGNRREDAWVTVPVEHNLTRVTREGGADRIATELHPLDKYLEQVRVQGIKIDTEGSELPILEGAINTIRRDRPWVVIEFNAATAGVTQLQKWPVHCFLHGLGYAAFRMEDAKRSDRASPLSEEWEVRGYCNLFYCSPVRR